MDMLRPPHLGRQAVLRAMENVTRNQCSQHFAASAIRAALSGNGLPGMMMARTAHTACGATDAHQQMLATPLRRLQQDEAPGPQPCAQGPTGGPAR
jgi:hypothetical protein